VSAATTINKLAPGRRHLVTPEGIDLQVELADVGARIGAFAIDLIIIIVAIIAAALALGNLAGINGELAITILILIAFFLRSFYFTLFEIGRRAATPGKMMLKIRVASRTSARLSAAAVFARNALREIGFFLPIGLLLGVGGAGVDGWMSLLAAIWGSIFLFFPLFNKDRLRVGDLVAGTWVVRAPRPLLAKDLAAPTQAGDMPSKFVFTPAQIDAYGVKELHVLEDVLRARDPEVLKDVASRIRTKIGWVWEAAENDYDFLRAYYAALRGRLENRLLMGVRRKDKFDV
jgi:uncharacterized RDD family membrane protein YckC